MNTKTKTLLVFVLGLIVGAGGNTMINRSSTSAPAVAAVPASARPVAAPIAVRATAGNVAALASGQAGNNNGGNGQKAPKQPADQQARAALALVGSDPAAEEYWLGAINNPDLPAKERKNLIEDLANVGLSSTKNPTPDDVQVIAYRLQLIEQLAQAPMDNTNAKALAEAQKDLSKTASRVLAQSQQSAQ